MEWPFLDAGKRFGELACRALAEGLQLVLRRDHAVVADQSEHENLTRKHPAFKEFLMGAGPSLEGVCLKRHRSPMRRIKF